MGYRLLFEVGVAALLRKRMSSHMLPSRYRFTFPSGDAYFGSTEHTVSTLPLKQYEDSTAERLMVDRMPISDENSQSLYFRLSLIMKIEKHAVFGARNGNAQQA